MPFFVYGGFAVEVQGADKTELLMSFRVDGRKLLL